MGTAGHGEITSVPEIREQLFPLPCFDMDQSGPTRDGPMFIIAR